MAKVDFLQSIPYLLEAPSSKMWIDYDQDSDVLYISFRKPQQADDSILEENIIYHYQLKDLVGMTILQASSF